MEKQKELKLITVSYKPAEVDKEAETAESALRLLSLLLRGGIILGSMATFSDKIISIKRHKSQALASQNADSPGGSKAL